MLPETSRMKRYSRVDTPSEGTSRLTGGWTASRKNASLSFLPSSIDASTAAEVSANSTMQSVPEADVVMTEAPGSSVCVSTRPSEALTSTAAGATRSVTSVTREDASPLLPSQPFDVTNRGPTTVGWTNA